MACKWHQRQKGASSFASYTARAFSTPQAFSQGGATHSLSTGSCPLRGLLLQYNVSMCNHPLHFSLLQKELGSSSALRFHVRPRMVLLPSQPEDARWKIEIRLITRPLGSFLSSMWATSFGLFVLGSSIMVSSKALNISADARCLADEVFCWSYKSKPFSKDPWISHLSFCHLQTETQPPTTVSCKNKQC